MGEGRSESHVTRGGKACWSLGRGASDVHGASIGTGMAGFSGGAMGLIEVVVVLVLMLMQGVDLGLGLGPVELELFQQADVGVLPKDGAALATGPNGLEQLRDNIVVIIVVLVSAAANGNKAVVIIGAVLRGRLKRSLIEVPQVDPTGEQDVKAFDGQVILPEHDGPRGQVNEFDVLRQQHPLVGRQ